MSKTAHQIYTFAEGSFPAAVPSYIPDNKAAEIINMEFLDAMGTLATRRGVSKVNTGTTLDGARVTSIFGADFGGSIGAKRVITSGGKCYVDAGSGTLTDITGPSTLPSNTLWQWKQFGSQAIGCNQGDPYTYSNPVHWAGSGNLLGGISDFGTAYAGSAGIGNALLIEIWNGRAFIVVNDYLVAASKLGDPLTWTIPGAATAIDPCKLSIGYGDEDYITGIIAWRSRLIIFKRKSIYQVSAFGQSAAVSATIGAGVGATDPTSWQVEVIRQGVGCLDPRGVQIFGDDVWFPCEFGIASLKALYSFEDVARSIVSRDRPDLAFYDKTQDVSSFVNTFRDQYCFACNQSGVAGNPIDTVYVCDMDTGKPRWTTFNGPIAGLSYGRILADDGSAETWIGGYPDIYRYSNADTKYDAGKTLFLDDGEPFSQLVRTKVYDLGAPFVRKKMMWWELKTRILTSPVPLKVTYIFDEDTQLQYSETHALKFLETGGLWGVDRWNFDRWYKATSLEKPLIRKFGPQIGSWADNVQFEISNDDGSGLILKYIGLQATPLGPRTRGIESLIEEIPPPPPVASPPVLAVVGSTPGILGYSTDVENFTVADNTTMVPCNDTAYNGARWVAVGGGPNTIAYSDDGRTWIGLGTTIFGAGGSGESVCWNGSLFVAVGDPAGTGNFAATSPDGITWTARGGTILSEGLSVAWNGTKFLAGGISAVGNTMADSTDGITWTGRGVLITASQALGVFALCFNGTIWVARGKHNGGSGYDFAYSTDATGLVWTNIGRQMFTGGDLPIGRQIAWNGSLFVAVGSNSSITPTDTIGTSPDGITWTARGLAFTKYGVAVCWNGDYFLAVGSGDSFGTGAIKRSPDGITWTSLDSAIPYGGCIATSKAPHLYPAI